MPFLNGMSPAMSPGVTVNSSDRFFSKSSYVLYLAFMAILFAFAHQKADLKRVQFAIALFVMNFVVWAVYLWALQHAPTLSGVFKTMFYLTMILAPGFLLHVLIDCNFRQAATSTTEETSGDRELDVKHDVANNIPSDSHVLMIEQEDERTSCNLDANAYNEVENNLSVIATDCHVPVSEARAEQISLNAHNEVDNKVTTDSDVPWIESEDEQTSTNPAPCNEVDNMSELQGEQISLNAHNEVDTNMSDSQVLVSEAPA